MLFIFSTNKSCLHLSEIDRVLEELKDRGGLIDFPTDCKLPHLPTKEPTPITLTFEEMIRQEELKNQQKMYDQMMKAKGPKPYTFGGNYDSDTIYGTDGDSGYTFKVNIVSDMPIPKKY